MYTTEYFRLRVRAASGTCWDHMLHRQCIPRMHRVVFHKYKYTEKVNYFYVYS